MNIKIYLILRRFRALVHNLLAEHHLGFLIWDIAIQLRYSAIFETIPSIAYTTTKYAIRSTRLI